MKYVHKSFEQNEILKYFELFEHEYNLCIVLYKNPRFGNV